MGVTLLTLGKKNTIIMKHPVFLGMIYHAQDIRNLKQQKITISGAVHHYETDTFNKLIFYLCHEKVCSFLVLRKENT